MSYAPPLLCAAFAGGECGRYTGDPREIVSYAPPLLCAAFAGGECGRMESGASGELLSRVTGDRGTRDSEVIASRRVTSE